MAQTGEHRLLNSLKHFVDTFNCTPNCSSFPILAFQFVSLDNIQDGKMVWWNYLHKDIKNKYEDAIKEFTERKGSKDSVKNTLINWEYDENAFWYKNLGSGGILEEFKSDFSPVGFFHDNSGIERQKAILEEKRVLLDTWENILRNKFCNKGSTIWVSVPHKENHGDIIYSSVFCLFNNSIPSSYQQLEVFRIIRNFIIDYILDLYRKPIEEKLILVSKEISLLSYLPQEYSFTGDIKRKKIDTLCKYFANNQHFTEDFIKAKEDALERIMKTFDPSTKSFRNTEKYQVKFKKVHEIGRSQRNYFFDHLYGRFLILAYCLVFNKTIRQASVFLIDKLNPDNTNCEKGWWEFDYLQSLFGIKGLKDDIHGTSGEKIHNLDYEQILPYVSDQEFKFILSLSKEMNKPFFEDISNYKNMMN